MNHISSWINHFKSTHEDHNKKHVDHTNNHQSLLERIEKLEQLLASQQVITGVIEGEKTEEIVTEDLPKTTRLESMSLAERKICSILNSLQNENGGGWVSMKKLAEETYPAKEYRDSRSHVSQLVSKLELEAAMTKKRKGKFVFVHLNKEIKELFVNKAKTKKKPKSSQKDS